MSERSGPQKEIIPTSRERLGQFGATLLGSAILISACSQPPAPTEAKQTSQSLRPTTTETKPSPRLEDFKDIYGECRLPTTIDSQAAKRLTIEASACMEAYSDSRIAAINYALEPAQARQLAEDIETTLSEVTDGLITPNVEMIEPTKAAKELYRQHNSDGCVNTNDLYAYSSYVAAASMPELNSYEKVIGLNQYPDCDGKDFAIAYSNFNRYSEVLDVDKLVEKATKNNGSYDSAVKSQIIPNPTLLATHEILHNFGLGHSGAVYPTTGSIESLAADKAIDLSTYLESSQYFEYGAYDVMGQVYHGDHDYIPKLNTVQMHVLEWPQRVLDKPSSLKPTNLSHQSAKFYTTSVDSAAATLHLNEPLDLPTETGYNKKINSIVLTPALRYVGESSSAVSVRIYGTSQTGDVIDLGGFYQSGNYSLSINKSLLHISLADAEANISYGKPAQ